MNHVPVGNQAHVASRGTDTSVEREVFVVGSTRILGFQQDICGTGGHDRLIDGQSSVQSLHDDVACCIREYTVEYWVGLQITSAAARLRHTIHCDRTNRRHIQCIVFRDEYAPSSGVGRNGYGSGLEMIGTGSNPNRCGQPDHRSLDIFILISTIQDAPCPGGNRYGTRASIQPAQSYTRHTDVAKRSTAAGSRGAI